MASGVYAHDGANELSPTVQGVTPRVYVPNSASNTVDVIDQRTFKIVAHYHVGLLPQHVTPSYDLKTLWVDNDEGNSLTPLSPLTGRPKGKPVRVTDPYNLYFTPDGRFAIVVAEREHRLDFRFAHTMKLHHALVVERLRRQVGVQHQAATPARRPRSDAPTRGPSRSLICTSRR